MRQKQEINLDLLKNELTIARTSFEISKKYKKLAQNLDNRDIDQKTILPFYIFSSFSHLNHTLISIRKIIFDKEKRSTMSIARYFDNGNLEQKWNNSKKNFLEIKNKYSEISKDINELIAHIDKKRNSNSIFQISEKKFNNIKELLDDIISLIDNFPNNKIGIPPGEFNTLINVMAGFDNLIVLANHNIKKKFKEI
jgi:hypothetical protein